MKHIISFDIGTSGIKCGLFDANLKCITITRCDYTVTMSPDGTAEADPTAYIEGLIQCTREALQSAQIPAENVAAMCITTQGETLIPVDKNGTPLHPAIVWLDGRAEQEAAELKEIFPDPVFKAKTGLPGVDGYTPLAKLLHIKRNMPEIFAKTHKFLLLEDYVAYRLTGRMVSEKSLLSSTGYFDLTEDGLWLDALSAAGIDPSLLPEVVDPGAFIGTLQSEVAEVLGLTTEVKLYAGAMDQLAGAVGCGNYKIGSFHETTGTAMIVATTSGLADAMESDPQLTVYRHVEKDTYLLLSIGRTATTILKWFAEQFYSEEKSGDIYARLSQITAGGTPGANGMLLLPYFEGTIGSEGGENLKGTFWNVGLHNTREDFVRAVFEGVAFMLQDNLQLMATNSSSQIGQLISIGGASKSEIWSQIKADVTGCQIITMPETESALLGCACIAAVGSGMYPSFDEALGKQDHIVRYTPDPENTAFYQALYQKYTLMKTGMEQLALQTQATGT